MTKKRDTSEQQQKFIEYLRKKFPNVDSDTYKDAAAYAGYPVNVSIASILQSLGDKLKEEVVDLIALYGIEAAAKQIQIMRNPIGTKWRAEHASSSKILDMLGVGKEEDIKTVAPIGIVFLPAKQEKPEE